MTAQLPIPPLAQSQITAAELRRWRQVAIAQAQPWGRSTAPTDPPPREDEQAEEAAIEVDWLLRELAQIRPSHLRRALPDQPLTLSCSLARLDEIWQRRLQEHQPLQYLVGQVPWRELELVVGPGVLIPRPETELLIDAVEQQIRAAANSAVGPAPNSAPNSAPKSAPKTAPNSAPSCLWGSGLWADIGTGSGAIALGLASKFKAMQIHAVDCSPEALAIAQINCDRYAQIYNLPGRLQLHLGQWLEPLRPWRGQFQGIVSNPPYIPTEAIAQLQPEVRDYEPHLALDGGSDGLDGIRHLVQAGAEFLQPGGFWIVELMAGQAAPVEALLQAHGGYGQTGRIQDLSGIERFVWATTRQEEPACL